MLPKQVTRNKEKRLRLHEITLTRFVFRQLLTVHVITSSVTDRGRGYELPSPQQA